MSKKEVSREKLRQTILDNARIEKVNEVLNQNMGKGLRRKSGIEAGIQNQDVLELMLQMRDGVLSSIELAFIDLPIDGDETNTAYVRFRLLSAKEELQISDEMRASKLLPDFDGAYELLLATKRLSIASSKTQNPIDINAKPLFSESDMLNSLTRPQVLALGYYYDEFCKKCSPKLREYTEADIQYVIDKLDEALQLDPKDAIITSNEILSSLDLSAMRGVIIKSVMSLRAHMQQMDKLVTGI